MDLALTDATGSGADLVPVAIRRCRSVSGWPSCRRHRASRWRAAGMTRRPSHDALGHGHRHRGAASAARPAPSPASRSTGCPPDVAWRFVADCEVGEYPDVRRLFLPMQCMHCAEPPCVPVCPTGASRQRADGIVWVRVRRLRGLRLLRDGLPVPRAPPGPRRAAGYFDAPTPSEAAQARPERHGVMTKCTFCKERVDDGLAHGLQPGRGSRRHAHVRGGLHRRRDRLRRPRRCREPRSRSARRGHARSAAHARVRHRAARLLPGGLSHAHRRDGTAQSS